jgi:hypothetical protein
MTPEEQQERVRSSFAKQGLMTTGVLTTEFKINLLAPAEGERILARGRVVKACRTLTLAQAEVFAKTGGQEKLIALLTATLMAVTGRGGATKTASAGGLFHDNSSMGYPAMLRAGTTIE